MPRFVLALQSVAAETPIYPSASAALSAAKPALEKLLLTWAARRAAELAALLADGHPTLAEAADTLGVDEEAARWYLNLATSDNATLAGSHQIDKTCSQLSHDIRPAAVSFPGGSQG